MKKIGIWIGRIIIGLLIIINLLLIYTGLLPVPQDVLPAPEDYGAGSRSIQSSITGLLREFPDTNEPEDNPNSVEKYELGRLLFFDPVLSQNNDISCATCHHPDYGFSDGLTKSIGAGGINFGPERTGGTELARNSLTLWNIAYTTTLFWDGRVNNLEEQAITPITHLDEMAVDDISTLEKELSEIPEYEALFNAAYHTEDNLTIENITKALATFERTLTSSNSPFDKYANGDLGSLTPSQKRGLTLFRSAATRCFECHTIPTFSTETFRVIGVPNNGDTDPDLGRAGISDNGQVGAFKVPTLRNIALTSPYMHNGVFNTLEEVIQFYSDGGGRDAGVENVDPFIQGFELTEQELSDLIAFLYSLTDESNLPEFPDSLPSGLSIIPRIENPARELVAAINIGGPSSPKNSGAPQELIVQSGNSIQEIVDSASPGDTILIEYGVYNQRVVVDLNDITILGIPNDLGEMPILDGQNDLSEAVISSGNNFEIGYLHIKNYSDNGILVEGVTGVNIHNIRAENTGTYGLYPVQSTNVLIENSEVSGVDDAGIYAGQCVNVVMRNNEVYDNVLGIEVENSVGAEIYNNNAHDNTTGILVVLLPQLTSQVSLNTKVFDNVLDNNNLENFAKEGTAAAIMPAGAGIAIIAADQVEVYGNTISNHKTAGIGIFSLTIAYDANEIDIGPTPENIYIHDNFYQNNGYEADEFIASLGIPGSDILWDVSGWNVRVDEDEIASFPPLMPSSNWSDFFYRMYWQILNFITQYI